MQRLHTLYNAFCEQARSKLGAVAAAEGGGWRGEGLSRRRWAARGHV